MTITARPVTHTAGGSRTPAVPGAAAGGGVGTMTGSLSGAGAAAAAASPLAGSAATACGCSGATAAAKRPKKSFAILRATPSISREPTCASLPPRSEEHTSELQSRRDLVCRLLLEKKKKKDKSPPSFSKKKTKITYKS